MKKRIIYAIILIFILITILFIINIKKNNKNTLTLSYEIRKLNGIEYPYFNYDKLDIEINKIIKENIFDNMEWKVNKSNKVINVFFKFNLNGNTWYKSINISLNKGDILDNKEILDYNLLGDVILNKFESKYSKSIYKIIKDNNFKNASLLIDNKGITIYYDKTLFKNIIYEVFITLKDENNINAFNNNYDKVVAFTFDDGPGKYTTLIMKALLENDSKATFFELGEAMKYNQEITRELYFNGMEVGSHTYSHKNLNILSFEQRMSEINSTNIIYNEITKDNIKLLRPPYGITDKSLLKEVDTPIILWNLDTKDWLYRDEDKIYDYIVNNIKDGSIILMHDIHEETLEAVKKVLPHLREIGYKITTVSELASEKGVTLEKGKIYSSFISN